MSVSSISPQDRDEIFRITRDKVLAQHGTLVGRCLSFAWHGYQTIRSRQNAPRVAIQAGSASWPRIPKELDDGKVNTHLTYRFELDSFSTARFLFALLGITNEQHLENGDIPLPEIHVWLGLPDTHEIIDFTTGTWPQACQEILGEAWLAPQPPEYFWGSSLPNDVRYNPDWRATVMMIELLVSQGRAYP